MSDLNGKNLIKMSKINVTPIINNIYFVIKTHTNVLKLHMTDHVKVFDLYSNGILQWGRETHNQHEFYQTVYAHKTLLFLPTKKLVINKLVHSIKQK